MTLGIARSALTSTGETFLDPTLVTVTEASVSAFGNFAYGFNDLNTSSFGLGGSIDNSVQGGETIRRLLYTTTGAGIPYFTLVLNGTGIGGSPYASIDVEGYGLLTFPPTGSNGGFNNFWQVNSGHTEYVWYDSGFTGWDGVGTRTVQFNL